MEPDSLRGIYELALDLGRAEMQRVVGNNLGTTEQRMAATALLLALDESQATAADVIALARFVKAVADARIDDQLGDGEDRHEELVTRTVAALHELESYFDRVGRRRPWLDLQPEAATA